MNREKLTKRLHRLHYYLDHTYRALKPRDWGVRQWQQQLNQLTNNQREHLQARVNYYNRLSQPFKTKESSTIAVKDFRLKGHNSAYFLDLAVLLPHFSADYRFAYEFGDVTQAMSYPTWVKSRPIGSKVDNCHSVLLKLDSVRHFYIPSDEVPYSVKKPLLVWRGAAHQSHRIALLRQFAHHPRCDIGCTAQQSKNEPYHAQFLSIKAQQRYRFILSIEGNDVATNLKWVMASNSLCFMTRPKYETWFMEGALQPGKHYVLLRDDYADLTEKMDYYLHHETEALAIIHQANQYVQQFFNHQQERLIQLLVMQKYFDLMH